MSFLKCVSAVDLDAGVCGFRGRSAAPARAACTAISVWFPAQTRTLSNLAIAASVIGWKRLTRFPSGSRKRSDRFPHGIVIGVCTN
jgi:hypothetical protein